MCIFVPPGDFCAVRRSVWLPRSIHECGCHSVPRVVGLRLECGLRSLKKGERQMDLRQLRYFIVVAEERHITRAAARLGMEQPPLSVQIKALEKELGISMLTRHPRGVELTAGGKALLDGARALLADLE